MSIEPFHFADACEILTPYLAQARRRETVRQAEARREADRASGVAWSGLSGDVVDVARSEEQFLEEAVAALDSARAFAASSRGRFLAGLNALEELGYAGAAERARAAFNRGFADPEAPACPAEIGAALAAIGRLPEARAACLALVELLTSALNVGSGQAATVAA